MARSSHTTLERRIPTVPNHRWLVKHISGDTLGMIEVLGSGLFRAHVGGKSEDFQTLKRARRWCEKQPWERA